MGRFVPVSRGVRPLHAFLAAVLLLAARRGAAAPLPQDPEPATNVYPDLHLRGFSDVLFRATDEPGEKSTFALGQINGFLSSRLSENISALAEIVVEADDFNKFGVEAERLLIEYQASDYVAIAAGRYHTAIGYYNTAYHHSAWMQTAVGRPFLFEFEDEGGILPIHNVGVSVRGVLPPRTLGISYVVEVGNGRTSRTRTGDEPVQNVVDENNGKAVNVAIVWRAPRVAGLQAGLSAYRDRLEPLGLPATTQTIVAAHVVYRTARLELMAEGIWMRHAPSDRSVVNIPAGYIQASWQIARFRPYLRAEYVNVPERDPILSDVSRRTGLTLGLRYDLADLVALKLQLDRTSRRGRETTNALTAQVAFAF